LAPFQAEAAGGEAVRNVVIVGAGQAGGCAAAALRSAGFDGRVTLVGAEDHPPYERPPLSKELLAGDAAVEKTYLRPRAAYDALGVTLMLSRTASSIELGLRQVLLDDGVRLPYDRLLLATGARARVLPGLETVAARVHYLRDIADALRLKERLRPGARLLVVGAGFVGLETAATAAKAGCLVTVIESQRHPLARVLPQEIGILFGDLHAKNGVTVRTGTNLAGVAARGGVLHATTSAGDVIEADEIVVGIGAVPNVSLAQDAGLAVEDGIVTDEFGRTSDPNIFAAGDATCHFNPILGRHIRLEAWQNAQNQAIHAAHNMIGDVKRYAEVPWFWTHQYDLNFQLSGAPRRWDAVVWRGAQGVNGSIAFAVEAGAVVAGACFNNPREMRFVKRIVASGATIDAERLADPAVKLADIAQGLPT
jgi:NADPH-dependent 2,4-dienoyl-CoA reductase/sulfur reductase-like enzyme